MALPDYFTQNAETAHVWGEAGASGVTATLSLDALASAAARMGASVDLGANWRQLYFVDLIVESGTAPTAGTTVDLYLACSHDNTNWPGGVTGSDAAYKAGEEAEWAKQLGGIAAQLIATNDSNTVQRQQPVIWIPKGRYVTPVVHNQLGQAFRDEATATNNDSRVILTPVSVKVQDSA
jgi:hypothetical protein